MNNDDLIISTGYPEETQKNEPINISVPKIASGTITVPENHDAVLIKKSFEPVIISRREALERELQELSLKPLKNDKDIEFANKGLRAGKRFIKEIEEERKKITRVLDDKAKDLINYERDFIKSIVDLVTLVNNNILKRQLEIKEEQRKEQERLAKEREAALAEANRVARIKDLLFRFETNAITKLAEANINNIDDLISTLNAYNPSHAEYAEFLSEAQEIKARLLNKFSEKKNALQQLQAAELSRSKEAEEIKARLEEMQARELQASAEKAQQIAEEHFDNVTSIQMVTELKQSQTVKPAKGLQVRWDFEITDPHAVPIEYLSPDPDKIKQAIKDGVREIPGIKIFEKHINVSR